VIAANGVPNVEEEIAQLDLAPDKMMAFEIPFAADFCALRHSPKSVAVVVVVVDEAGEHDGDDFWLEKGMAVDIVE